jgi:hypothetical protein
LQAAIAKYPDHLSGRDQATSKIIRATNGRVLLKGGAEGFVVGFVVDLATAFTDTAFFGAIFFDAAFLEGTADFCGSFDGTAFFGGALVAAGF